MGYYTRYTLDVEPVHMEDRVREALNKVAYNGDHKGVFVEDPSIWNGGAGPKWYDSLTDCCKVSAQFPNVTITITSVGEGKDANRTAYKGGKRVSVDTEIDLEQTIALLDARDSDLIISRADPAQLRMLQSDDPLVSFLYTVMRDHITPGAIENLLQDTEMHVHKGFKFTNGPLAEYAEHIAHRLRALKEK